MCKGTNKDGSPCQNKSQGYCHLHRYQMLNIEKPEECPVCVEEISITDRLSCGHWVHMECVAKSMKAECPVCRHHVRVTKQIKERIQKNVEEMRSEWNQEDEQNLIRMFREELEDLRQNAIELVMRECICPECVGNTQDVLLMELFNFVN